MTIYAKENSLTNFQFDYTNNKGEYKIPTTNDFGYAQIEADSHTTFHKNTITINVPKGKYTPTDLAQYLSSEFQKTNKDVKSLIDPTNNKLLLTAPEIVETLGNDNCYIISEDINNNSSFVK